MNRMFWPGAAYVLLAANTAVGADPPTTSAPPTPTDIRRVAQQLQSEDPDAQLRAVFALTYPGYATAAKSEAPRVREILRNHNDLDTRAGAGLALARMGLDVDTVVPALLDVMRLHRQRQISSGMVLIHSRDAMQAYGSSAVPALRAALKNEDRRDGAVQVLTDLGAAAEPLVPDIVQLLKEGAVDGQPAGRLLAQHGQSAARSLVALLKEDDAVADRAVAALYEFNDDAVNPLALALFDEPRVRQRAFVVVHYLFANLNSRIARKPELGGALIPGLARLADDPDADVRRKAVVTLCRLGDPGAPEVLRALRDRDVRLRLAVCEALNNLSTNQIPETVRLPLMQCLTDADPLVRIEAADVLRGIEPDSPRIVPTLLAGLWDNRGDVRYRALVVTYHMSDDTRFASAALARLRYFDPDRRVRRLAGRMLRKMEEEARQ